MNQKYRFPFNFCTMIKNVRPCGFLVFSLIILLTLTGCGSSNFSKSPDEATSTQDEKTSTSTVREHWKTLSEVNVVSQSVTFTSTKADSKPPAPATYTGATDSITVDLSLISGPDHIVSGAGNVILDGNVSSTGNSMNLGFQSADVNITKDALTVSGSAHLTTKLKNGSIVQPLCTYTIVVTRSDSDFFADVTLGLKDLETTAKFKVSVFRTSDAGGPLSFMGQTWAKQSPGIRVHFPRKLYSDQTVSKGTSENTLLAFQFGGSSDITNVTGQFHIPSNLSANGDDIDIDIDTQAYIFEQKKLEPNNPDSEYINPGQHTVTFQQSGEMTTHDTEGHDVDTDYSLSVTVTAKNVFITSPNPDYPSTDPEKPVPYTRVDGVRTEYTALVALILKDLKNDTGESGEQVVTLRTTLRTEIQRTDYTDVVYDNKKNLVIPTFSNGAFILRGGNEYRLTHATSVTDITRETVDGVETVTTEGDITEDIVKTSAGHVQLDLDFSGSNAAPAVAGSLILDKEACPATASGFFVNVTGLPVSRTEGVNGATFTIGSPEEPVKVTLVKRLWKGDNCPRVTAFLSLVIRPRSDGTSACDVSLSSPDLETAIRFTSSIVSSTGDSKVPSVWTLSKNMDHTISSTVNDVTQTHLLADGNLSMSMSLGYRVDHGAVSINASGNMALKLDFIHGDLMVDDAETLVSENGKDIVIQGTWKYINSEDSSISTNNIIVIVLKENESGDREFHTTLTFPAVNDTPSRTVNFIVPADKTSESKDLLGTLLEL